MTSSDIREIDAMNMPELWKLWVRGLHEHPEAFGASYAWAKDVSAEESQALLRQIREGDGFILGAFNEETLIGELNFNRQQGEKFHHKGDIGAVYVVPEQRGKGVAKALVLATLERTRTITDLAVISLSVNAENKSAIQVYQSRGFKAYGVEPKGLFVGGKYIDLLHMTCAV